MSGPLFLVCSNDVPEVASYSFAECMEYLPFKFDQYLEDDQTDAFILRIIRESLTSLRIGRSTTQIPGVTVWKVYGDKS